MKKSSVIGLVVACILGAVIASGTGILLKPHSSHAQSNKFEHIVPLTFGTLLAFYDTQSGTVYIYDNKFEKVAIRVQLVELGQPLEKEILETEPSGPQGPPRPGMTP